MKIAQILEEREPQWKELERLTRKCQKRHFFSMSADEVARFSSLYRMACSDLALAESYHFPMEVVRYLNNLIGVAHHQLYRSRFSLRGFLHTIFVTNPRWIFSDRVFWICLGLFWIPYFVFMFWSYHYAGFAEKIVGTETLASMESSYAQAFEDYDFDSRFSMIGFYILNNAGIGLKCFAMGVFGCVFGLGILIFNAVYLGSISGYMFSSAVDPAISAHFREFVMAHGPFELMAIVLSASAGVRIGFAFVSTHGMKRLDSVRIAARKALPMIMTTIVLFTIAALIEAFVSPDPLDFLVEFGVDSCWLKGAFAFLGYGILFFYIVVLGGFFPFFQFRKRIAFEKNELGTQTEK